MTWLPTAAMAMPIYIDELVMLFGKGKDTRVTYDWGDVPHSFLSLLQTNVEDDEANHGKHETTVTKPKPVFRSRVASNLLSALVHPQITDSASKLFANNETDHNTKELEAELLGVETKLGEEKLRNLDGEKNAAEAEDHRVGDCGDPNRSVAEKEKRLNKLDRLEGGRVNALEVEVLLLESGDFVANDIAHVKGLGTEEEISNELYAVGLLRVSIDRAI